MPGRLITNNILVAYEVLHSTNTRMYGKLGYMALKLDMSKTYDCVEMIFLEEVMHKLGFDRRWINLMMGCIRSVSYAILINGEPLASFIPSRGLRQ